MVSANNSNNVTPLRPVRKCAICNKPASQKFHPFCSARCANIDLNRWLSGTYIIPAPEDEEEDELPEQE